MTKTAPKLHPLTQASAGILYGSEVHPRRIPLADDGIEMVAKTHRTQLEELGFELARLKDMRVLECGGTGRDALAWQRLGAGSVTHIDLSEENPARVRAFCNESGIDNVESRQEDILSVDLPSQYFDIVRSRGVVHHLGDPALALARYARWTRKGGLIHFNVYRGGTFYYYGVKLIRELVDQQQLQPVLSACQRQGLTDSEVGILLDDFFVPYMHTGDPEVVDHDIAAAGLARLWPDRDWQRVDHDVRYPDMPEKVEHLQYWVRKISHHEDAEGLAAGLRYHLGVDDVAVGRQIPGSEASFAAFKALAAQQGELAPQDRADAWVRLYQQHHYQIATVAMSGRARHRLLTDAFERELSRVG